MSAKPFIDTNVVVYAFSAGDPRNPRAEDVLIEGGIISTQVLNEFANVARRKRGRDWKTTERELALIIDALEVTPLTLQTHNLAVSIAKRHGFGFYDGAILASAKLAGCRLVYSEDLGDGQVIEGVTIRNPFR